MVLLGCGRAKPFDMSLFNTKLYTPQYAEGFEMLSTAEGDATLIVVNQPWQGDNIEPKMLLIDHDGHFASQAHPNLQRITGKVERVVCMSSSHIAMLEAVGKTESVVGVSGKKFIFNEKILAKGDKIGDVGYDGEFNIELLLSLKPDLVLLYGVNGKSGLEQRLEDFKIPYIYIGEYLEASPLGKAEWMVVVAEIMGCREQGELKFEEICHKYCSLSQQVEQHIAKSGSKRPKVLLNTPYRDVWYLPAPKSYMVQLIEDAGGEAYTKGKAGDTTTPIGIEQAYSYAQEADLWLNVGVCNSLSELAAECPLFASTALVKEQKVFNNNLRRTPYAGSDFWESGVVMPDVILEDLIKIIHPDLLGDKELYYHKQLR